jgi:hypothetical protein
LSSLSSPSLLCVVELASIMTITTSIHVG